MPKEDLRGKVIHKFREGVSDNPKLQTPSEKVADEIARDMLMPKEMFIDYYSNKLASDSIDEFCSDDKDDKKLAEEITLLYENIKIRKCSNYFGVPTESADKRIEELGLRTPRTQYLIDETKREE